MRRRPSILIKVTAAATSAILLASCAGCEARVYGSPSDRAESPQLTMVAPQGPVDATPEAPANQVATGFDGLEMRAQQATSDAAKKGADIGFMVLDRETGQRVSAGHTRGMATASVVKLFIADDLLLREPDLSPDDRAQLDVMLRSSDDSAAEVFWNRGGGSAIVTRVAARYGLAATSPPPNNGRWWNTMTSAEDLVRYYDMLLSGAGGLPMERANIIVNNLAQSTPMAIDGTQPGGVYPQRFGIPDGLPGDRVAVKQGWMCCIGSDWMHMSTGVVGADRRYVMVIYSLQPTDAVTARNTITAAVKTMFPTGRI